MSKRFTFRLTELHALHASLRFVFLILLILTAAIIAYVAVRLFLTRESIAPSDLLGLALLAVVCTLLCIAQLRCLRHIRHDAREKIEQVTFVDELTGAYSPRHLQQRVTEELRRAKRHGTPLSVVCMDFDAFRLVNDTYGRETGDAVLRSVCQIIRGNIRIEDFVGRLDGDEFLIVLPHTESPGAVIAAERLREKLGGLELRAANGDSVDFVRLSMGVASYPAHGDTPEAIVRAAEEAMRRARKAGGDRVCL